jgi:hypothetical protein
MPKTWKREELERILGKPAFEGNESPDEEAVVDTEGHIAIAIGRIMRHGETPPAPKPGVGRWIEWDCYGYEKSSKRFRTFAWKVSREIQWRVARGLIDSSHARTLVQTVSATLRSISALRRELSCRARTSWDDGAHANTWVLTSTCSKHAGLDSAPRK